MPFNKNISGYDNEEEFVRYLDGKTVGKVNPLFDDLLIALFGNLDYSDKIESWVSYSKKKADICIKINNRIRGISIKKGIKNSVHMEDINLFCEFLKELGVKNRYIIQILKYHYADGTIDGSGKKRLTTAEYKKGKERKLKKINKILNSDKILDAAIERFVTRGNNSKIEIDAIIYGVVEDFLWITNKEIKYIIKKRRDINTSSLHFGSLYYQPMNRNIIGNPIYEFKRNFIQIKWYNISDDIIEVMARYRNS